MIIATRCYGQWRSEGGHLLPGAARRGRGNIDRFLLEKKNGFDLILPMMVFFKITIYYVKKIFLYMLTSRLL